MAEYHPPQAAGDVEQCEGQQQGEADQDPRHVERRRQQRLQGGTGRSRSSPRRTPLEGSPKDARKLTLGSGMGSLSLALCANYASTASAMPRSLSIYVLVPADLLVSHRTGRGVRTSVLVIWMMEPSHFR
jgi:hypothetical protein